jgi:hypothetical protein
VTAVDRDLVVEMQHRTRDLVHAARELQKLAELLSEGLGDLAEALVRVPGVDTQPKGGS